MYEPLYKRVKPVDIEEVVGQGHLLGSKAPLRILFDKGEFPSLIFYGPPGTGKTLVAELLASRAKANFVKLSAVNCGVQEIKRLAKEAETLKRMGRKTVLFLDEIHRFNRAQQDVLLPYLEDGLLVLIGASTENPIFALNKALLSRVLVFEFKPLKRDEVVQVLRNALRKVQREKSFPGEVLEEIAARAGGDARRALGLLELVLETCSEGEVTMEDVFKALGSKPHLRYDRDDHYNVISAFIKSVRGSDPDAALYWLAVMLEAGEDPLFITRRLLILAAEDVGMADPVAMLVAAAAHVGVSHVGVPEGELILAFATVYLATAPKSNSCYEALKRAKSWVEEHPLEGVPVHLMDSHAWQKRKSSERYLYPHDYPGGFVKQRYMPYDAIFYKPKDIGREAKVKQRLKELWNERYSEEKDA